MMPAQTASVSVGRYVAELTRLEENGLCIGFRVTLSDQPCFTLRYLTRKPVTDGSVVWPVGDFDPSAVDWHLGDWPRQFSSPAELLVELYSNGFREFPTTRPPNTGSGIRQANPSFPEDGRNALLQLLVADDALRELLDTLATAELFGFHGHALNILSSPEAAAELWRAVRDSHQNLFLLFWLSKVHAGPSDSPTQRLRRIGCGRGLALRLRALPTQLCEALVDLLDGCKDIERTALILRRLAQAMARLRPIAQDGVTLRLELLFKLCHRLASLDQARLAGVTHLPRRFELSIGREHGRCDDYRGLAGATPGPDWTPISWMVEVYQAGVGEVVKAGQREDVWRALHRINHVLDWLSVVGGWTSSIEKGVGLKRLFDRAEAWFEQARNQARQHVEWPCALRSHESAWREYEATLQTGYEVVPLVSTTLLSEEGVEMQNCLVSAYPHACASGSTRVFSFHRNGLKDASVELAYRQGRWQVIQLIGFRNQERIEELHRNTPLGRTARALAEFYNQYVDRPFRPFSIDTDFPSRKAFLDYLSRQISPPQSPLDCHSLCKTHSFQAR